MDWYLNKGDISREQITIQHASEYQYLPSMNCDREYNLFDFFSHYDYFRFVYREKVFFTLYFIRCDYITIFREFRVE